jgi:hypothetical protein
LFRAAAGADVCGRRTKTSSHFHLFGCTGRRPGSIPCITDVSSRRLRECDQCNGRRLPNRATHRTRRAGQEGKNPARSCECQFQPKPRRRHGCTNLLAGRRVPIQQNALMPREMANETVRNVVDGIAPVFGAQHWRLHHIEAGLRNVV